MCHRIDSVGDPINNIPSGGMDDPERTGPGGMDGGRRSLNPSLFLFLLGGFIGNYAFSIQIVRASSL